MGQVRHGSAAATAPSRGLGINPKAFAKWRKRETVADLRSVRRNHARPFSGAGRCFGS